jgi:NAD(P)-dependent dehydrogenase (short-subunit alcohol dehydrogenase family)
MTVSPSGLAAFDLTGQTALVTGAAGLLGRQHAAALAEIGARVVLTDLSAAALAQTQAALRDEFGDRFAVLVMDVTDEASVRRAAAEAGEVGVLVNNAAIDAKVTADGLGLEQSRVEHFPLDAWNLQVSVGLTGAFLCSRVFGSAMAERGGGAILNIASDLSVIAPDQRLYRKHGLAEADQPVKPVTYSVIKAGLVGLTRYLAGYWAAQGVRVNALSPGGVYNDHPDAFVQRLAALIPMGRMAGIGEYRAAVQFLCSPASSYMTGQNLLVDGGRTIL